MSRIKAILVGLLIGVVLSASLLLIAYPILQAMKPVPVPPTSSFLSLCSGSKITPETELTAASICLGRISGFVIGYNLTVEYASLTMPTDGLKLWCMNGSKVTDGELYEVVAKWASANPTRLKAFVDREGSPNEATTLMFIAALHDAYPCKR
jgi:Rap1a immunity proteins